ncbi:MAG: hypothetical protein Q8904_14260 [Bacteroidota bacterium]|nr:hypothetical protein [Bacteroidota bacterium]
MQDISDFTKDHTPTISTNMQHFITALVTDVVIHPGNFESGKKQLKAYCEQGKVSYTVMEHNLSLFFGLLEDYRTTNTFTFYKFLKLQARFCFIDEQTFGSLVSPPDDNRQVEKQHSGTSGITSCSSSSSHHGGMVGGPIIGL